MTKKTVGSILAETIKERPLRFALLVLAVAGAALASLVPPQILKLIIDQNLLPQSQSGLLELSFFYLSVLFFICAFDVLKEIVLTAFGQSMIRGIRAEMALKASRLTAEYFSGEASGAAVSRFLSDVDAVNELFGEGIVGMAVDLLKIAGIIVSVFLFSVPLGLFTLLLIPLLFFVTRLFQKRSLSTQVKNRVITGKVNNHISETLNNYEAIKVYRKESFRENAFADALAESYKTVEKVNFYDSLFPVIVQLLRSVAIAAVVVLSLPETGVFGLSAGAVAAAIDLVAALLTPLENLGMELQSVQQAVSGLARVNEFLAMPEDDEKQSVTAEQILAAGNNEIKFDNVSFAYPGGAAVLKNISFSFCGGQRVTFAGRTGVGKSTLFKLLTGLLKPIEGRVTFNGFDVYSVPAHERRKLFGIVSQEARLIPGTAAEQISLRDESISREAVESALKFVGLFDTVAQNGLDAETSGGVFSQGQKQLLAVARAVVSNPPVLLLDEVTANLDSVTEEKILSVLKKASENRVVFSVSHRLTSLEASDTVVILENGSVKTICTAQELIENDEWYRSHLELENLEW